MRESLAGAEDGVRIGTRGGSGSGGGKGPFSRDTLMVIVGAVSTLVVVGVILAIALPLGLRQRPAPNDGDGSLSSGGSGSSTSGGGQQFEWDTLVSNGFVVDGTGLAGFYADVAIADGKIVAIGANLSSARAREVIDASGLVVSPGFIDSHVHSDWVFAQDPTGDSKLRDGITSELTGMCGFSLGPCTGECLGWRKALFLARIPDSVLNNITTLDDAYKHYERNPPMTNLAMFVGWNTVRMTACGYAENCSAAQLSTAKTLIDEAMLQGAWGLSHGLEYVPSSFSSREELVETAAVAAARGGFMPVHMRNEKIDVLDSVAEVIDIARRSGIRPQISHFKIAGLHLSYKIDEMLAMFDAAVSEGMDLWADAYPYNAMGTTLALGLGSEINNLPLDQRIAALQNETVLSNLSALADSGQLFLNLGVTGWSDILVVGTGNSSWDGKSVPNISSTLNLSPFETWIHVLLSTNFKCSGVYFAMNETIVQRIMKHPRVMVGSDGSPARPGGIKATHPRRFGTASRAIGHYGRDVGLFPLEYAVYRITGMVARRYSIPLRGQIAVGNWADITIFDRDAIVDKATYENMEQYSEGIVHVLVNGKVAVRNALPTGVYAGMVIRGPAYQP